MRPYTDLKLEGGILRSVDPSFLSGFFSRVGIKEVAFSVASEAEVQFVRALEEAVQERGVRVARRVDLMPKGKRHLLKLLREVRGRFEVVGVKCTSREVALTAARDGRVDLISFVLDDLRNRFTRSLATICASGFEVVVREVGNSRRQLNQVLSRLMREIEVAVEGGVNVIISSGAGNVYNLQAPRDMAALGEELGLGVEGGLAAVSDIPHSILEANRRRLGLAHIMDGVRVMEG